MVDIEAINDFVARVAERFRPDRIVLFGSYASGNPNADSDVDLLVIVPFEGKPWRTAATIREQVPAHFPMDLLVRTPDQIGARLALGDTFLEGVLQAGKTLYEA